MTIAAAATFAAAGIGLLLAAFMLVATAVAEGTSSANCASGLEPMSRVDLFFGAAGGRPAWRRFLAEVVTPRFPDGFTSFEGSGQWRGPRGLRREATHVLVVYYRRNATSEGRIEAIRSLYKKRFRQTSVLRADSSACVGF